jgi:hypothetical protein
LATIAAISARRVMDPSGPASRSAMYAVAVATVAPSASPVRTRATNRRLGVSRIHLSVSRCRRRLRELERSGVLRAYRAIVDAEKIGLAFTAIVL